MTYALGIDVGTTYTAAAVARDGRAQVAALGYRATSIPTVVLLTGDGRVLVGEAAERRATHEPDRVAREFKRRVGDPTPLLLGGTPVAVDRCLAEVVEWVTTTVSEGEGGPPGAVTVTHPANWGEFKRDVLREALRLADVPGGRLLAEPVAAATWYADAERLTPGQTVAVYDLGGGTFDAAVLRRREDGRFETLGRTEGIERLGGIDVDQAVYGHVLRFLGDHAVRLRHAQEPATVTAMAQLRRACVEAKEALSAETSVAIPIWLPGWSDEVLLHRQELEDLVGPLLQPTVDALARVVASAGLTPDELDVVLLVGGSSRIPLIAQQVTAGLGRPIAVDAHPKHPVSLGAALDAMTALPRPGEPGAPGRPAPFAHGAPTTSQPAPPAWPAPPSGPAASSYQSLPPLPPRSSAEALARDAGSRRLLVLASLATPVVLVLFVVFTVIRGQGDPPTPGATGNSTGEPASEQTKATDQTSGSALPPAGGGEAPPPSDGSPTNLLADATLAFDSFASVFDGAPVRATEVLLYADFATTDVQVPDQPTYVDRYTWRDGDLEGPEPVQLLDMEVESLETDLFDLSEIDPALVARVTGETLGQCPGEGLEITHVIIGRILDERLLILVYASHPERGGGGYVAYAPDGTVASNACT